jgi:putative transposase
VGLSQAAEVEPSPALPARDVQVLLFEHVFTYACSSMEHRRSRHPEQAKTLTSDIGEGQVRRRTHVARMYPTAAHGVLLDGQGHTARALWNLLHEWHAWGDHGRSMTRRPSIAEMDRQLREARTDPLPGWEWLAKLPAQATQKVFRQYLDAWEGFFKGLAGPPNFKNRNARMAVDIPQASALGVVRLNHRWGEVTIPLVGRLRFRWTRPIPGVSPGCLGRVTGARLVKDPLGWHIGFRIEEPVIKMEASPGPPVGVDRGVVHTLALSDGQNLDMPFLLSAGERRRLRRLELQAARQRGARKLGTPVSKRAHRTYKQIAGLRARQGRRRNDWLHKATTKLAKNHGVIVVEDLRVASMTGSARGTPERPGKNVTAKARLNRSILGMAWGKCGRMLTYKAPASGGVLVKVPAAYSSQSCAQCSHVAEGSRRSRDLFQCVACGHKAPADTNAAQVLLAWGLAVLGSTAPGHGVAGRGAFAGGRAAKRQLTTRATL